MSAKELSSKLKPILDQHNIKLIGIGFDAAFVKPFVNEGYFSGELYIDLDRQCYNALQYSTMSYFQMARFMISFKMIQALPRIFSMGIKGDARGDGFQQGGALVADKNGRVLKEFIQLDPADHIPESDILKALKINL